MNVPAALAQRLPGDPIRQRIVLDDITHRVVDNHEPLPLVADRHGLDVSTVRVIARGWHPRLGWTTTP